MPHNFFSHFPLAGQTLFLFPVTAGVPEAAAGFHWTTLLVALAAMTSLGSTLGAWRRSWFAPVLLLACWHAVWVSTVAAVDMLVVVAILEMAEHVVAVSVSEGGRAIGVGYGAGWAFSVKYTALVPAAAVVDAASPAFPADAAWAIAIGAASSSFWWVRNLGTTGNPVFPLLWRVFSGHGWTSADDERYTALVREGVNGLAGLPRGVVHLVRPPEGLGWWALAALPLVAFALTSRNGARGARIRLASASAMMLIGWLVTSQTTRYALPLAAFVAVLAAAGLGDLSRPVSGVVAGAPGAIALHGVVGLGGFFFGVLGFSHAWSDVEGWRHRVTVDDPVPAYRACDRALPPDARVLIVGEGRSWGMPRPHHASSAYDRQLAQEVVETSSSARDAWVRLRAARFAHLLVNWGEVSRLGGTDSRVLRWAGRDGASRWREVLEKFSSPVFEVEGVEVRALAADETSVPSRKLS